VETPSRRHGLHFNALTDDTLHALLYKFDGHQEPSKPRDNLVARFLADLGVLLRTGEGKMTNDVKRNRTLEDSAVGLTDASGMETKLSTPRSRAPLLTVAQVAGMLQVSEAWVRDHSSRKNPRLERVKVGKLLRFRIEDVDDFLISGCQ
jgi:hypothetical protein